MNDTQQEIIRTLNVIEEFEVATDVLRRINFLKDYLQNSGAHTFVLGLSGGVDSLTAGLLAQRAVVALRSEGRDARFIAVRLPYGTQADEADAQKCLSFIQPDRTVTIDIRPSSDAMMEEIRKSAEDLVPQTGAHFHLGNIKARERMIAQYALAGFSRGLVIGTDHAAEALMGFYTKFGDGAADLLPLAGLNKRRVRAIAKYLGAPDDLVFKVPTADLESDAPLKPDEDVYGVTYEEIDDFLEGKDIRQEAAQKIFKAYHASEHKRQLPAIP